MKGEIQGGPLIILTCKIHKTIQSKWSTPDEWLKKLAELHLLDYMASLNTITLKYF